MVQNIGHYTMQLETSVRKQKRNEKCADNERLSIIDETDMLRRIRLTGQKVCSSTGCIKLEKGNADIRKIFDGTNTSESSSLMKERNL